MLPLLPTILSVAVSTVAKMAMSGDADGKAAAAGAKSAAGDTRTGSAADAKSGFQSVLDKQTANSAPAAGQAPNSISPELLANLYTDGDAHPGQGFHTKDGDKSDPATAIAAVPAPATDLAAMINAAAAMANPAAGQAALALNDKAGRTPDAKADAAAALNAAGGKLANAASAATATALQAGADLPAATGTAKSAANALAATGFNSQGGAAAASAADQSTLAALEAALRNNQALSDAKAHASDSAPLRTDAAAAQSLITPASTTAPAPSVPSARLDMPVGTQGWDQALGQRVVWMVGQRDQTAEIHVHPPELGPLTVTVSVSDNTASASFVAPHATTRDAIADAMPKLRDMFADAGINLGQVSVSAESFSQGNGAHQAFQNRQDSAASGAAGNPGHSVALPVSPVRTSRAQLGMVDTFA